MRRRQLWLRESRDRPGRTSAGRPVSAERVGSGLRVTVPSIAGAPGFSTSRGGVTGADTCCSQQGADIEASTGGQQS